MTLRQVSVRAKALGDLVCGFRLAGQPLPVLNPPDKAARRLWQAGDVFVVFAEEDMLL